MKTKMKMKMKMKKLSSVVGYPSACTCFEIAKQLQRHLDTEDIG